jgi:hypothetical protein
MSTGAALVHGVSGYPCLGVPGDFQDQRRGEPWQVIVNDPIRSYLNAQNHIGIPMSNFNEPWTGGVLQEANFNGAPYRSPFFTEPLVGPPGPAPKFEKITAVNYDPQEMFPVQLPVAPLAPPPHQLPVIMDRQNQQFNAGGFNEDEDGYVPQTTVRMDPYTQHFQGGSVAAGVHPNNDKAGHGFAPNTAHPDFQAGQAPFQKLPAGQTVGAVQPIETPQLWELAPPPDPPVMPTGSTGALQPTAPGWW